MSGHPASGWTPVAESEVDILPDFPPGPLDVYRKQASFSWKKLRLFVEEEALLRFKMQIWKTMEADPLFQHSPVSPTMDELRRLTVARVNRMRDYDFFNDEDLMTEPRKLVVLTDAMNQYDGNLMLKYAVVFQFFVASLRGMGTEKHQKYIEMADQRQIWGAFCMTEISHGTNTKKLRTTATFDPATQGFVIHTPDFEAAKCWAGALGQQCTHATVFAQLVTPDGTTKGLHAFFVPIRNPQTMLTYPGVIVGDMGEKLGLNAVDNGFLLFNNYHVHKDCLLDKTGTVNSDGQYITPFKNPNKRFGASLGALLGGRTGITSICSSNLAKAAVIAVRYSAVRRQFGPTEGKEVPVLEYQLQQWRLIPNLAGSFVLSAYARRVLKGYMDFTFGMFTGMDRDELSDIGIEMHALVSSGKPLTSWMAQHGIQDCREACGGHGYLKAAGFGGLRNDNDANCTYEGANDVILQQTSNWLLSLWAEKSRKAGKLTVPFKSPLGSVLFLHDIDRATNARFTARTVQELAQPSVIFEMYEWLMCYLLEATQTLYRENLKAGKDPFTAKNDMQVYYARTLSLAYIEHFSMRCFWNRANEEDTDPELKPVLTKICTLFGLWRIETHLGSLYEGGFAKGPLLSRLVRESILAVCTELKPDAVALADALAPPDFVLNSALGRSDGEVYKAIESTFYQNPGTFERPAWWQEMTPKSAPASKL